MPEGYIIYLSIEFRAQSYSHSVTEAVFSTWIELHNHQTADELDNVSSTFVLLCLSSHQTIVWLRALSSVSVTLIALELSDPESCLLAWCIGAARRVM